MKNGLKIACATVLSLLLYWILYGHTGLDMADEGYLWYGSWRTYLGEVPLRDFQSYDPGRYYWAAAWFHLFGDGIIALRIADMAFQAIGVVLGLLVIKRLTKSFWAYLVSALVLAVWMLPIYKTYDHVLAIVAVYICLRLLEKPTGRSFLFAGIAAGLAGFIGRNHGVYQVAAVFLTTSYLYLQGNRDQILRKIGLFFTGIVIGYSPFWLMLIFVPGFWQANWDIWRILLSMQNTNMPLPVPWPWTFHYTGGSWRLAASDFLTDFLFLALPLVYGGLMARLIWSWYCGRRDGRELTAQPAVLAALFSGVFYAHYIFSRADVQHLAFGIPPFLLCLLAIFLSRRQISLRIGGIAALLAVTILVAGCFSPYYNSRRSNPPWQTIDIRGDRVKVNPDTAAMIRAMQQVKAETVPADSFLIAPYWVTCYPLLQVKAPVWEIYFLVPLPKDIENRLVRQLSENQASQLVVGDLNLDGREDLYFHNTHPRLYHYINEHYEKRASAPLPGGYDVWMRRNHE